MESLIKWIKDDYIKRVQQNTSNFPLNRIYAFINLKYLLPLYNTGYDYVPLRIHNSDGTNIIFAILYKRNDKFVYMCLSPTYESSKGEFRDSFCSYEQLNIVYEKYGKILAVIEDILLKQKDFKIEIPVGINIAENITIKLLTLSSFITIYRTVYNQIQLHTHKIYINIINNLVKIDKNFIFNNYTESKEIYNHLFRNYTERPSGQKLTPLTVGEVISVGNISYKPWRELIISYGVSDMVLNYIAPVFAIGSNWTYIENINENIFDNMIIKHKLIINKSIQKMVDDYKKIYEDSQEIEDIEHYRENLLEDINDINKNKLLSHIALARIDEYVGFTIGTIPRNVRKAKIVQPHYENFITNIDFFNKYIFDILYGCHVIHKKLGIINFDLHLNNVTIMKVDNFYKTNIDTKTHEITEITYSRDKKYCVAYVIGNDSYYFPFDGFYGAIIDFSDSIINETFLDYSHKYGNSGRYDTDAIIDFEKDEIFDKLADSLPYAAINKDKVKGAIISDYENMFKVIATIDYITFLRKLRLTFEREMELGQRDNDLRKFTVNTSIMDKLKLMEDKSLSFMLKNLQIVISKDYKNSDDIKFPGDILLKEFFHEYCKKSTDVYEAWNFNNNIEHSVSVYKSYPPWTKREIVEEKFGKNVADEFFSNRHIPSDFKNKDTHLDFIIERIKMDSDPLLSKFSVHTRTRKVHRDKN